MTPTPASNVLGRAAQPELQLRLTIDEINLVLEGVGNLPFARVFNLVAKIQAQAAEQFQAAQAAAAQG